MTTGLERFGALMTGQLPDRVPITCNLLEQGAKELELTIPEYYSKGKYVAEGQSKLIEKFGLDVAWAFMHSATITQLFGARNVIYSNDGPPNAGEMVIKKYEDIANLIVPTDIENHPAFREWKTCITLLKKEMEGKCPVCSVIIGAFSLPAILMGQEKWFELLFFGPETVRNELLDKCIQFNDLLAKTMRSLGVDMISYSNAIGTMDVINYKQFVELALPVAKKDFENIGTAGVVYFNGGGRINETIDILIKETGIAAFYLHPNDDVTEAKKIINGRGLMAGVINDIKLLDWGKEEIFTEVERIIKAGAEGGGFIFGTLVMPFAIPEKNIFYLMEAANKFGAYN